MSDTERIQLVAFDADTMYVIPSPGRLLTPEVEDEVKEAAQKILNKRKHLAETIHKPDGQPCPICGLKISFKEMKNGE